MWLKLLAMVNMKMFRELGNFSMSNVVEEESFTAAIRSDETGTSTVSFQDQVSVLEEDLISIRGLHGKALNFHVLRESFSRGQLQSLVLGEASNDVFSLGEVASIH
jgi:hypothetical protein